MITYKEEIKMLRNNKPLAFSSGIIVFHPFSDDLEIVWVGGHINQAHLPLCEKNSIILPGKSHVVKRLVTQLHEKVYHQGRLIKAK